MSKIPEVSEVVENRITTIDNNSMPAALEPKQTFESMLAEAIRNKEGLEVMQLIKEMYELQLKERDRLAEEAHAAAMARFQAKCPPLVKDAWNEWFKSHYVSYGNLVRTCVPVLGEEGLSMSHLKPNQKDNVMELTCRIKGHGHHEDFSLEAPIDKAAIGKASGQKSRNALQDIKSTLTYLRSATAEMALGVAGTDATKDDDGNSAGSPVEYASDQAIADITAILQEIDKSEKSFCKYKKIDSLEKLPAKQVDSVLKELEKWRKNA